MQAPALVDLRRCSFIMIKILQNCTTCSSIQATHKTSSNTCNVLLSSFLVRSNRTTLQTWVYGIFNHANWPIKRRHSHSLCSNGCLTAFSVINILELNFILFVLVSTITLRFGCWGDVWSLQENLLEEIFWWRKFNCVSFSARRWDF